MMELVRRYKKTAGTFLIFIAYSATLFWAYYDAQSRLRDDVLNEVRLEAEKHATAVSYFLSERRNDLADMAAGPEVGNFFVNRDLGMSYEYGLGLNVQAIEARFDRLVAQKQLVATPVYRNVVVADSEGTLIAPERPRFDTAFLKTVLPVTNPAATAIGLNADGLSIFVAAPVWVRNVYRGQVIATCNTSIFEGLAAHGEPDAIDMQVIGSATLPAIGPGITRDLLPDVREALQSLFNGGTQKPANGSSPVAVVRVAIDNTPFSLLAPVSRQHLEARSTSGLFLAVAALVPLIVILLGSLDVLERKRAEELQERARLEAERLARMRSDFVANMSHEIRTPLNGILGLAQIGQRDNAGSAAGSTFARILDSGRLLLAIINDILDFAKIEAGKLTLERVPVALDRLIDDVVAMQADRAAEKGIDLQVVRSPDVPAACLGDEVRLAQILTNLLSNAIKFTDSGQVLLSIDFAAGQLRLTVADTGIGMAPETLERLFTPFEQADSSTTRRFGGTGLGLAITKQLIDVMGGQINVHSAPGAGATFDVRIPCRPASSDTAARADSAVNTSEDRRLAGIRLLVAEDNEVNRLVLDDMLAYEGAQAVMVDNGRQAVDAVVAQGAEAFDLVLMDIQMPEMDGYEAARRLRDLAPGLPVVAQTAHALADEIERCRAAGMVDQLTKPIDGEKLVAMVRRHACGRIAAAGAASPPLPERTGAVVDWQALQARYGRKPDFVDRLMTTARQSLAETPARLRAAAAADDLGEAALLTHSLKGVAGNLLAAALAQQATDTEAACRNGAADARVRLEALADAVAALLAEIGERGKD